MAQRKDVSILMMTCIHGGPYIAENPAIFSDLRATMRSIFTERTMSGIQSSMHLFWMGLRSWRKVR
eukprot:UN12963